MMKRFKVSRLLTVAMFVLAFAAGGVQSALSTELIFNSFNAAGVGNGPTVDTTFTLTKPTTIATIVNYHWNYGAGQDSNLVIGWIGIEQIVSGEPNVEIGRWPVIGNKTAPVNVMWFANANVLLGPGTYKIIDSDPATWSYANYSYAPVGTVPYGDGVNWEVNKGFSLIYAAATVTATTPANHATGVSIKQPLTITFSEKVVKGPAFNNITATYINYAGTKPTTVTVPLTKTLTGNVLKLTPTASYGSHALVTVKIPAGSVVDLASVTPGITVVDPAPSASYQYTFSTSP
jgi:hypothetical protein